jgi:uncharacterized phage infection (PIP) family protein YhgE
MIALSVALVIVSGALVFLLHANAKLEKSYWRVINDDAASLWSLTKHIRRLERCAKVDKDLLETGQKLLDETRKELKDSQDEANFFRAHLYELAKGYTKLEDNWKELTRENQEFRDKAEHDAEVIKGLEATIKRLKAKC